MEIQARIKQLVNYGMKAELLMEKYGITSQNIVKLFE